MGQSEEKVGTVLDISDERTFETSAVLQQDLCDASSAQVALEEFLTDAPWQWSLSSVRN